MEENGLYMKATAQFLLVIASIKKKLLSSKNFIWIQLPC